MGLGAAAGRPFHPVMKAFHPFSAVMDSPGTGGFLKASALACVDLGVRGTIALARLVPPKRTMVVAPLLGKLERGHRKRRCIENMMRFLGRESRSETEWEQLWNAHVLHVGQTLLELLAWEQMSAEEVMGRVSVRGAEHLRGALRDGRGAMVLASHTGNFVSVAPAVCRLGLHGCSSGNAMPTPHLEKLFRNLVGRFGMEYRNVGSGIPSAAAATFRQAAQFIAFVDLSLAGKRDEWFPFGQAETNLSLGPALLALKHRVPVLGVSCRRLETTHHEVTFHPALPMEADGDARARARQLTAQALQVVVAEIRQHPAQWWQWDWAPLRRSQGAIREAASPSIHHRPGQLLRA